MTDQRHWRYYWSWNCMEIPVFYWTRIISMFWIKKRKKTKTNTKNPNLKRNSPCQSVQRSKFFPDPKSDRLTLSMWRSRNNQTTVVQDTQICQAYIVSFLLSAVIYPCLLLHMVQANGIIHIVPSIIFFMVVCGVSESYQRFSSGFLGVLVWGFFAQYGLVQFYCYISFFSLWIFFSLLFKSII